MGVSGQEIECVPIGKQAACFPDMLISCFAFILLYNASLFGNAQDIMFPETT